MAAIKKSWTLTVMVAELTTDFPTFSVTVVLQSPAVRRTVGLAPVAFTVDAPFTRFQVYALPCTGAEPNLSVTRKSLGWAYCGVLGSVIDAGFLQSGWKRLCIS